jgi:hypothetical protein
MNKTSIKLLAALAGLLALISAAAVTAQKHSGTWMELPKKDAQKLLDESPWSHTQIDTDTSEMFYSPTRQGSAAPTRSTSSTTQTSGSQQSVNDNRADRGAVNQAVSIKYRICFLSARPVREAFAKMILSAQAQAGPQLVTQLQSFVDRDFSAYIVVAVTVEASDKRFSGPIMQAINSAATGTLKNKTYLERQDGKRLFLIGYYPPIEDGLGAKFVFSRTDKGEPFLNNQSDSVRFVAEFNDSFKLNMRFKISDMLVEKKLEY